MFSVQIPSKIMNFVFHQNDEFQSDFVWVPMMRSCHVDKAAEAATQDSSSCRQKSSQVCRCASPGLSVWHSHWSQCDKEPIWFVMLNVSCANVRNATSLCQSYYWTWIQSHMWSINWCHFQWMTPNHSLKIVALFRGEFLKTVNFRDKVTIACW